MNLAVNFCDIRFYLAFPSNDHYIFGCMICRDKLEGFGLITMFFEDERTQPVGEHFGLTLHENPMFQDGLHFIFRIHLFTDLFVAARRTNDISGISRNSFKNGVIGGCITGMERDEHIDFFDIVITDISLDKRKPLKT